MKNSLLRRTACVTLVFFVWFMLAPDFAFAANAADDLAKAEELYKEMQYEKAVNTLNSYILANQEKTNQASSVAKAYYLLAKIYFDIDEYDPKVKENLAKVFQYDENFTTKETNARFNQLVSEASGQTGEAPGNETVNEETQETTTQVIEKPAPKEKKKKFPVVLVIGGIIVVGALVYFLVVKKSQKYDLNVTVGEGATGTPATGTTSHKKGTAVSYSYSAQTGYSNLQVLLDGAPVAASGSVTMDANHSLTVTTQKAATLVVNSTPTGAQILIGNADTGFTTNHTFAYGSGGTKNVKLRKLGYQEYSTNVNLVLGETKTVNKTLVKGFKSNFTSDENNSILWLWEGKANGDWSLSGGRYIGNADLPGWNYTLYNYNYSENQYTVTVKMKRSQGSQFSSNAVFLGTTSNGADTDGYLFNYTSGSWVSVWKITHENFDTGATGTSTPILSWKNSNAVNDGLGVDNTFKIVRDGSNYTYYLNNSKITEFNNPSFDPSYIFVCGYCGGQQTKLEIDYAYLEIGATAGSVPGPRVDGFPTTQSHQFAPGIEK